MGIHIGGIEPTTPEDPKSPKKIPQWHPTPTGTSQPGISVKEAVEAMKDFADDEYVEPHIALSFLARSDWIQPFCEELANKPKALQEQCWKFLGDFGVDKAALIQLAADKNYEGLKDALPKGEVIAAKLLGVSG